MKRDAHGSSILCLTAPSDVGDYVDRARHELTIGKAGDVGHQKWAEEQKYSLHAHLSGVLCLAEDADNILMWAHYSDSHTGFCIKFDTSVDPQFFGDAKKVKYQNEFPVLNWWKDDIRTILDSMLYYKSHHWAYEKEWRVMNSVARDTMKFNKRSIESIILGCRVSDEHQKEIMKIVKTFPCKIKVFKASLKERDYSLTLDQID